MANFEDGSYSCNAGITLIAKVLAGKCQMIYTKAAVGKGYIPDGESPKTIREPPDYVMDAQISGITNPVDGECQVTVQIDSTNVEKGFFATGIMLYAYDPDEGEIPYTYLCLENGAEWIRPASSAVGKLATFELIAAVGDVGSVTAEIDPNAFVTKETVQQMIDESAVRFVIGSIEPTQNNTFWLDTSGYDNNTLELKLTSNSSDSKVFAEIDSQLYGVENAGISEENGELKFTIN